MGYDVLAESLRLIGRGVPDGPGTLSRRRRFVPLAVDTTGAVAATLFARRGVSGQPQVETWLLERRAGEWVLLGGGGGSADRTAFADRLPAHRMGGLAVILGETGTARRGRGPFGLRGRWARSAHLRVAAEVDALRVERRRLPVARHGHMCVVWTSRTPPRVELLDAAGRARGTVALAAYRRMPRKYGHRRRWWRRGRPGRADWLRPVAVGRRGTSR